MKFVPCVTFVVLLLLSFMLCSAWSHANGAEIDTTNGSVTEFVSLDVANAESSELLATSWLSHETACANGSCGVANRQVFGGGYASGQPARNGLRFARRAGGRLLRGGGRVLGFVARPFRRLRGC